MTEVLEKTIQYYTELPQIEVVQKRIIENVTIEETSIKVKAETIEEAWRTVKHLKENLGS